jgi:hypothetical protein
MSQFLRTSVILGFKVYAISFFSWKKLHSLVGGFPLPARKPPCQSQKYQTRCVLAYFLLPRIMDEFSV